MMNEQKIAIQNFQTNSHPVDKYEEHAQRGMDTGAFKLKM